MNVEESIEYVKKNVVTLQKQLDFMIDNRTKLESLEQDVHLVLYTERPRLEVELESFDFKDVLTSSRNMMRNLFGTWKDEQDGVWCPYGDLIIMSWKDPDHPIELWIKTTVEKFPEEMKASATCKWTTSTSTYKTLVCEAIS